MAELLEQQFLTLSLARERYAVPVISVLEVLEDRATTRLPKTAPYLKGIIDLRGKGIPVMDLRLRFGMSETESSKETAIVVVELADKDGSSVVGLLADAVHEVIEIAPEKVEEAPGFGAGPAADFIKGIGRQDEGFVLILDLDRIFAEEGLTLPAAAGS
jgi:purine-binding chemotaxis protein CheW